MEYHCSDQPDEKEDSNMADLAISVLSNAIETLIQGNELVNFSASPLGCFKNRQNANTVENTRKYYMAPAGQTVSHVEQRDAEERGSTQPLEKLTNTHPLWGQVSGEGKVKATGVDKPRKRSCLGPENWKRVKAKRLREHGEAYEGRSKNKMTGKSEPKYVAEKKMGCRCSCASDHRSYKCASFSEEERQEIFQLVWSMTEADRKIWVFEMVNALSIKQRTVFHDSRRSNTLAYNFKRNGERLRVCKTFFLRTTGLRQWWVRQRALKMQNDESSVAKKPSSASSRFEEERKFCKDFLQKLPFVSSHPSSKASSSKRFLDPTFVTFADVYRLYKRSCFYSNKKILCRQVVRKIFEDLNLSIFSPKKEQTDAYVAHDQDSMFIPREEKDLTDPYFMEPEEVDESMDIDAEHEMLVDDEPVQPSAVSETNSQNTETEEDSAVESSTSESTFWVQGTGEGTVLGFDRPRKRKASKPENWKKVKARKQREHGEAYEGRSKNKMTGKLEPKYIREKTLGPRCPCMPDHKSNKCADFSEEERQEIFRLVWSMTELQRRLWVSEVVNAVSIKQRTVFHDSRRTNTLVYNFKRNGERLRVCKTFFLETTGLRQWWVRNWVLNLPDPDTLTIRRPSFAPQRFKEDRQFCEDFLQKLPCVPSHYSGTSMSKHYLEPTFRTYADVYRLYKKACSENNKKVLCRQVVHNVFEDLNLAISRQGKDSNDTYVSHEPDSMFISMEKKNYSGGCFEEAEAQDSLLDESEKLILEDGPEHRLVASGTNPRNVKHGDKIMERLACQNSHWIQSSGEGTLDIDGLRDTGLSEAEMYKNWKRKNGATVWSHEKAHGGSSISRKRKLEQKEIDRRILGARCSCTFDHKTNRCASFSEEERQEVFKLVWSMTEAQRSIWVSEVVSAMSIKQRAAFPDSRRTNTIAYFFKRNGERVRVCKNFFLQTTALRQWWVRQRALKVQDDGLSAAERSMLQSL
ncbi:uncharacterized protein LOC101857281 [Aplysia californica]|uniref:Uncharacterized protein LOC101857281 n=1 Tax=Aplysia californica TaxID=6500 RepID=A0ABM0K5F7_APLCA|nr:uncharacterized protein LOC101857281 [Aplysia californica]XP_005109174.1 uncharacterized protein LOC101857281 [Aplysia californica]